MPFSTESSPTLYDEIQTLSMYHQVALPHRSASSIAASGTEASVGTFPYVIAHLQRHDSTIDNRFAICIAGGSSNCIAPKLYQLIP